MGNLEVILLDTHVVVWVALDPSKVSREATAAIAKSIKAESGPAMSVVSLFEIAHLVARGRIEISSSLETFLQEIESRFVVLPLSSQVAARAVQLPASYPRDLMDRIIGATAIVEGLPFVTADAQIRQSEAVETIW
jgi:PIN domain nuclease of toxin-antitoxin system